jgi:hypothetical protein
MISKRSKTENKENANDFTKVRVVENFGDARRLILQTMIQIRDGEVSVAQAMAMAAHMKEANNNMQVEINLAKVHLQAEERGHNFGRLLKMGKNLIVGDEPIDVDNKKRDVDND